MEDLREELKSRGLSSDSAGYIVATLKQIPAYKPDELDDLIAALCGSGPIEK